MENTQNLPDYIVYTDGGCAINPGGHGAYAAIIIHTDTGEIEEYNLSNWYHLPEWIEEIAERLRNIQIEHKPALDLIREFDSPDSFFYLDPPYLLNTRSAKQYQHEMTEEDHIKLLETIVHCSAQIMISGYDTPLYNDYLHTWDTLRIPNQTTSGVIREEIVWMNYTHQLSLYDFGIL